MKAFDVDEDHTIGEDEFVLLMKWASFLKDKAEKENTIYAQLSDMASLLRWGEPPGPLCVPMSFGH